RPRSRFAKFTNLPELQQMFRSYADVQTAAMLNLPRPRLAGDKATVIACPMAEEQWAIQEALVARYEAIRSGKVKPWEDNALAITTDGRKLALDARLLSPTATDFPDSKINALVANVTAIWQRTAPTRSTQLIFADLGINPTPWGYTVYGEVREKLVQHGIPRQDIAAIGDADTDAKKHVLFEKVRQGTVRILLGSTQKMGTGTNVQQRLVASHSLDCPWKCAEIEQRDGRILRCPFTHNMARLPDYASNVALPGYASSRVESATDERAHGGLLLPPQRTSQMSQRRDVCGITGDVAWSGKLFGHTVNGGKDALRMERESDRADFLQTGVVALLEARLLIRVVPRRQLAAQGGKMLPQAIGAAPQAGRHGLQRRGRCLLVHGVLNGPLEDQDTLLALPRSAGHNLTTQLRIIIPGHGGRYCPALTDALQRGRRVLPQGVLQERVHAVTPRRQGHGRSGGGEHRLERAAEGLTPRTCEGSGRGRHDRNRGWRHGDRAQRHAHRRRFGEELHQGDAHLPTETEQEVNLHHALPLSPPAAADTLTAEVHRAGRPARGGAVRVIGGEGARHGLPGWGTLQTRCGLQQVSEGGPHPAWPGPGLRSWGRHRWESAVLRRAQPGAAAGTVARPAAA
ncbi:MAG TPA: hypothetical protein VJO72_05330, partial [Candidatus Dormibacteraeota bacterium]|nr:hypothetical protein [Candidatus Dormibacteraeota bacterium]